MSRVPDLSTLIAISGAFDASDRLRGRRPVPVLCGPARPLMPSEIVARLRAVDRDMSHAVDHTNDELMLRLEIVGLALQVRLLADRIEGLRPIEMEGPPCR